MDTNIYWKLNWNYSLARLFCVGLLVRWHIFRAQIFKHWYLNLWQNKNDNYTFYIEFYWKCHKIESKSSSFTKNSTKYNWNCDIRRFFQRMFSLTQKYVRMFKYRIESNRIVQKWFFSLDFRTWPILFVNKLEQIVIYSYLLSMTLKYDRSSYDCIGLHVHVELSI